MRPLIQSTAFPTITVLSEEKRKAVLEAGHLPTDGSLKAQEEVEAWMCLILAQLEESKNDEAGRTIAGLLYSTIGYVSNIQRSWLWLAKMSVELRRQDYAEATAAAENSLRALDAVEVKKGEDLLALLAALLYNLAYMHFFTRAHHRAAKELTKAQQLYERLAKKNEARFSEMLIVSIEASTKIFQSRQKQMNVLAHYQNQEQLLSSSLSEGAVGALESLVDTLRGEGDILLDMGNPRAAVKYYTKALRYQKKTGEQLGLKELQISISMADALMRLINRRAAAEKLLSSLLPLAHSLHSAADIARIEQLQENKVKTKSIMSMLKSFFMLAIMLIAGLGVQAQNIVGHRGSAWGVENTRAAFINGALAGSWGLECDIHTTSDNCFIVCHDSDLKRIGGPAIGIDTTDVATLTQAKILQTRGNKVYAGNLMTLGEYLDLCKQYNVVPVIEVKWSKDIFSKTNLKYAESAQCYTGVPALLQLLADKQLLDKAVIISFMPGVLNEIYRLNPAVKMQYLITKNWEEALPWCVERKMDIDAAHTCITKEMVDAFHKAGLKVNAWTVDDPAVFSRLKEWGVDYITTNKLFPNP